MTRICVAGAGAIGSLFAAHLARVADVSALVRRPEHANALREHGLRISGRADFTADLAAATSPDELEPPELVILACKGTDLETVAAGLAGHWPDATLMTVQNGIGADEIVARHGDVEAADRGHVHERHPPRRHARRVRARHRDVGRVRLAARRPTTRGAWRP